MITMFLPAISGPRADLQAAATAAPEEMPTGMPSSRATARAMSNDVCVGDRDHLVDDRACRELPGTKPAPMPWILCGPGWPPDRTGDFFRLDGDHLQTAACAASAPGRRR